MRGLNDACLNVWREHWHTWEALEFPKHTSPGQSVLTFPFDNPARSGYYPIWQDRRYMQKCECAKEVADHLPE
jgi:hypothetical protein